MNQYFEMVEKLLSKYPLSWQKNYYQNKLDLLIEHENQEIRSIFADYDHDKNRITIYGNNDASIVHELFHMAFRDKDKVGKEIGEGITYENGVCFKDVENDRKHLDSVTEGFAEYLSRLCQSTKHGRAIEYFFIDLLINIYGEDILEYSFCNDPLGFIMDIRFYNMVDFAKALDNYYFSAQEFMIISYMRKTLEEEAKSNEMARKEILECIDQDINLLNEAIPKAFNAIIEEYLSYSKRKIEKDLFVAKLSSFLTNPDHGPIFVFDKDCVVRKKIQSSIDLVK